MIVAGPAADASVSLITIPVNVTAVITVATVSGVLQLTLRRICQQHSLLLVFRSPQFSLLFNLNLAAVECRLITNRNYQR